MATTDAARIWNLNHRVLTSVLNECANQIEALGLGTKEFFVLAAIEECRYPAELATRLVIPKPTVTVYLKTLSAQGFVRREIDQDDLRRHRLALSPTGRETLQRALVILSEKFDAWLARLDTDERDELRRLLEKLLGQDQHTTTPAHLVR